MFSTCSLRTRIRWLAAALAILVPISVCGQTTYFIEYEKTIATVGAQDDYYFVRFLQPLVQRCQFDLLFISANNKGLYAQVLAASLSGRKLKRLDYSQPEGANGACTLKVAEFAI